MERLSATGLVENNDDDNQKVNQGDDEGIGERITDARSNILSF